MREKTQNKCLMGYSSAYPIGRERGFFSSSLEFELESGIGDLRLEGLTGLTGFTGLDRW